MDIHSSTAGQHMLPIDIFKAFSEVDIGDIRNLQSQTVLVLVTSLTFLVPAVSCWRLARLWHSWVFVMMTVICCSFHFCAAGEEHLGSCAPATTQSLQRVYRMWMCFCFLQMAFLMFGPEDPQLQQLADKSSWKVFPGFLRNNISWDVIVWSRILPMSLLLVCNQLGDSNNIYWQNMLLAEMLLVFASGTFWLHRNRRNHASDVLLRFKFWHRLLHRGLIPALMLFWIFCIMSFADQKALHAMLNLAMAAFAVSVLPSSHARGHAADGQAGGTSLDTEVLDSSAHNPSVAHILMGSIALIVLPTAVVGASYDWCPGGQWLTISSVMECQPGGYFVAIVAVPTFTAVAAIFRLIDCLTPRTKTPWTKHALKPWESPKPWETLVGPRQRSLVKHLGCLLGYAGAAFGLASALIMKGTPLQNGASQLLSSMSLGALALAGSLTVLCSDPTGPGYPLRLHFTIFICMPLVAVYFLLTLSGKSPDHGATVPGSEEYATELMHAISEYVTLIALVFWPLTWAAEVQEDVQRKESGSFSWPTTSWRFD